MENVSINQPSHVQLPNTNVNLPSYKIIDAGDFGAIWQKTSKVLKQPEELSSVNYNHRLPYPKRFCDKSRNNSSMTTVAGCSSATTGTPLPSRLDDYIIPRSAASRPICGPSRLSLNHLSRFLLNRPLRLSLNHPSRLQAYHPSRVKSISDAHAEPSSSFTAMDLSITSNSLNRPEFNNSASSLHGKVRYKNIRWSSPPLFMRPPEVIDLTGDPDFETNQEIIDTDNILNVPEVSSEVTDLTVEDDIRSKAQDCTASLDDQETLAKAYAVPCDHDPSQFVDGQCQKPCGVALLCGDVCKGTCHSCSQGRIHILCSNTCGNLLICGHVCKVPCKNYCPPCSEPCIMTCAHRKCQLICGIPCEPCMEPCVWRCDHLACTKRCYEECDRDLCPEHCSIQLSCGHSCVGVCGEICPPCKQCKPDLFTPFFMLDEEDDPSARYMVLSPCNHCLEVTNLQRSLTIEDDSKEVVAKRCPRCKSVITNCQHLKGVKPTLAAISQVKQMDFGTKEELAKLLEDVQDKVDKLMIPFSASLNFLEQIVRSFSKKYPSILRIPSQKGDRFPLKSYKAKMKMAYIYHERLDKHTLSALLFIFGCMQTLDYAMSKYWNGYEDSVRAEFQSQIKFIVSKMNECCNRFGNQQYSDFTNEVDRFYHAAQLKYLCANPGYYLNKDKEDIRSAFEKVNSYVNRPIPYTSAVKSEVDANIEVFRIAVKAAPHITEEEKKMLREAFPKFFTENNRGERHAYKCSEGHIYVIGECGRPAEIGTCPICKEKIGGVGHNLLSTSSIADELFDKKSVRSKNQQYLKELNLARIADIRYRIKQQRIESRRAQQSDIIDLRYKFPSREQTTYPLGHHSLGTSTPGDLNQHSINNSLIQRSNRFSRPICPTPIKPAGIRSSGLLLDGECSHYTPLPFMAEAKIQQQHKRPICTQQDPSSQTAVNTLLKEVEDLNSFEQPQFPNFYNLDKDLQTDCIDCGSMPTSFEDSPMPLAILQDEQDMTVILDEDITDIF